MMKGNISATCCSKSLEKCLLIFAMFVTRMDHWFQFIVDFFLLSETLICSF
jgi:hypothetical protein